MGLFLGDSGWSGLGIGPSRLVNVPVKEQGRLMNLENAVPVWGIGLIVGLSAWSWRGLNDSVPIRFLLGSDFPAGPSRDDSDECW